MLLELPTHLQTIIVSYITPVSDVQALFSTCTQLHALAQSPGVLAQWLVQRSY
ncbi:hypothetical protein HaLaN_15415 [Haematococcus lacustris]|uniref:F-box domain-containing protein n=1 Tax=Haematococcus lacustris TaxID=44745 RepID=A0A699ZAA8_HAELA|nr:hypothetical protein HaLaN_15415 [Haematococcus lacustris]